MTRKVIATLILATLVAGYSQVAAADAVTASTMPGSVADVECSLSQVADVETIYGGGTCFNLSWTSQNCCSEIVLLGGIAGATGNAPAVLVAALGWYYYCR